MDSAWRALSVLPLADWLAVAFFITGWWGYVWFARRRATRQPSILASTNHIRWQWMMQVTWRENRIVDAAVVQNLSTSPSFFASTTILIIGGLMAVLGTGDKATELVQDLPFAARTSALVFDLKLILMTAVFVHAFFRFTWSMRQYTFGALMVAAAPDRDLFAAGALSREDYAARAGKVVSMAAETFNDGLRACYFAFAVLGWFLSPLLFAAGTLIVVWVLYRREFRSDVLATLADGAYGPAHPACPTPPGEGKPAPSVGADGTARPPG
jgi:uncharacterized membrane protein